MNFIGKANSVHTPIVRLNGVPVTSVSAHSEAGGIPTCQVGVKPEDLEQFTSPDQTGEVTVDGQTLFFGYIVGVGYSNMNGNLTPSVSLIHVARDLDETTTLIPGIMPGSTSDVGSLLFVKDSSVASYHSGLYKFQMNWEKDFGAAICEGMINLIQQIVAPDPNGYLPPSVAGDKNKAIAMLTKIGGWSKIGKFAFTNGGIKSNARIALAGCVERAGTSSSIWDTLSGMLAAFDCGLVCKPQGEVTIMPNFAGIAAKEITIPTGVIQKVDKSSLMVRSPKECLVMAQISPGNSMRTYSNQTKTAKIGQYSSSLPGARGAMLLSCPGWLNGVNRADMEPGGPETSAINAYAASQVWAYANRQKTFNIVTPVCIGAFPGVCATFAPFAGLKGFDGGQIPGLSHEIDGYCKSIDHVLSGGTFCTIFRFECALEKNFYTKQPYHQFFPNAEMAKWT